MTLAVTFGILVLLFVVIALLVNLAAMHLDLKRRHRRLQDRFNVAQAALAESEGRVHRRETRMAELSRTDRLTGLTARHVLQDQLPVEMALVQRDVLRLEAEHVSDLDGFGLILIEIGHLEEIGHRHGQQAVDMALAKVAMRLYSEVRDIDLATKWGDGVFIILARRSTEDSIQALTRRLLEVIAVTDFETENNREIPLTANVGFLLYPLAISDQISSGDWEILLTALEQLVAIARLKGDDHACGILSTTDAEHKSERERVAAILSDPDDDGSSLDLVTLSLFDESSQNS